MDLECEICYCPFDEDESRPRVLPCAHTYCESCLDNNIKKQRKICPACREPFDNDTAKDLPANYALEKLLQKITLIEEKPEEEPIADFNYGICPKHKHNRIYFVCKNKGGHVGGPICVDCKALEHIYVTCNVISVEDDMKELKKRRTEESIELVKKSEIRINGLKLFNDRVSDQIKCKEEMLQSLLEEIEEINEIKSRADQAESVITENMNTLKYSKSQLETSSTKNEITAACQYLTNEIKKAEPHIDDIDGKYDLDFEFGQELLALQPTNFIQEMKEREEIEMWAVAQIDEDEYGALLFIRNDEVHMEALMKRNSPPDEDYGTLSASRLLSLLPEENPKVYMTLSLNGDVLGTVYITMCTSTKTGYGRQFLALFTGSLGPSYKGMNMHSEYTNRALLVTCYMKPDGTKDSVPIVPDYNYGSKEYSKWTGSVFNYEKGGFRIFHIDGYGTYNTKYGEITSGMDVIQGIVDNKSWNDVEICDLGVVLG